MKLVLLGDSIFDNQSYVNKGEPDVRAQVQQLLASRDEAVLLAVDGHVTQSIGIQMGKLPPDATHLILSVGGNDALGVMNMLQESADSTAEVVLKMAGVMDEFERNYATVVNRLRKTGLPVALCTIYYPNFPEEIVQRLAVTALSIFNDVVLRQAFKAGLPVLDLRLIFTSPADYANPIEPSAIGGAKLARSMVTMFQTHDFSVARTGVYF